MTEAGSRLRRGDRRQGGVQPARAPGEPSPQRRHAPQRLAATATRRERPSLRTDGECRTAADGPGSGHAGRTSQGRADGAAGRVGARAFDTVRLPDAVKLAKFFGRTDGALFRQAVAAAGRTGAVGPGRFHASGCHPDSRGLIGRATLCQPAPAMAPAVAEAGSRDIAPNQADSDTALSAAGGGPAPRPAATVRV